MSELGPPTTTAPPIGGGPPDQPERVAGTLAMVAFVLCSVVGPLIALWWARRHSSAYVRRYALLSLALEVPILFAVVLLVPVAAFGPTSAALVGWLAAYLVQLGLCIYSIVLAVGAWRGRGIAEAPAPDALVRLIG